ncbi:hypothetical protein J422_06130 [Methanocaldococcus villosus KIN24-T80]|uniref:Uncharacterized protein n=1 Tax=Methanocaldococcus villosus KIN24-T80 TaxID=1069083 RepID=N6UTT2_9EURY|nr:hypothetical protein [Methanocaldococcus villosus]ENN95754.1 hypothetical protein J422_06130 [Methanocaldococcus villosus KIN24-T80]
MDENKQKLHYIIYLLTRDDKKWVRQIVVFALIYYFIKLKVLSYTYAPMPYIWQDKIKFINISYDALEDLNFLLDNGYISEILLSIKGLNEFIVGYKIGKSLNYNFSEKDKEIIEKTILDENGNLKEIIITENGIKIKSKEGDLDIILTELERIKYKSKSYIMKVSLWDIKP